MLVDPGVSAVDLLAVNFVQLVEHGVVSAGARFLASNFLLEGVFIWTPPTHPDSIPFKSDPASIRKNPLSAQLAPHEFCKIQFHGPFATCCSNPRISTA